MDWSGVSINLAILFRDPPFEILVAENMPFQSCDWIFTWLFLYDYLLPQKTEYDPCPFNIMFNEIVYLFCILEHKMRDLLGKLCNFQDF